MAMFNSFCMFTRGYIFHILVNSSHIPIISPVYLFFYIISHYIPIKKKKNIIINHNVTGYLIIMKICSRHVHVNVLFSLYYIYISESLYISIRSEYIRAINHWQPRRCKACAWDPVINLPRAEKKYRAVMNCHEEKRTSLDNFVICKYLHTIYIISIYLFTHTHIYI